MKHKTNIFVSTIMLTLMLFGASGVSVEKCSCTGRVMLTIPADMGCCPGENGCMTVKTIHLSDYVPSMTAHVDMPLQPFMFSLFSSYNYESQTPAIRHMGSPNAAAPPGCTANTVTVLRV